MRLDDTYSFQVINKTVKMVIPALIQVSFLLSLVLYFLIFKILHSVRFKQQLINDIKSLSRMLRCQCPLNFRVVKLRSSLGNIFSRNICKHPQLIVLYGKGINCTSALTFFFTVRVISGHCISLTRPLSRSVHVGSFKATVANVLMYSLTDVYQVLSETQHTKR